MTERTQRAFPIRQAIPTSFGRGQTSENRLVCLSVFGWHGACDDIENAGPEHEKGQFNED